MNSHAKTTTEKGEQKAQTQTQAGNHTALYRKYRPAQFAEVIGQAHIVDSLTAAISTGRIGHAYLFSGGRGTGKTTTARIFAREIGVSPADIYEMDAASNRTVEDARALREAVHTLPFESPRKVYIIDEAHMLTKDAFNTLLKTLEEPPAHAVFILATTELDKLPDTIVSRCQVFLFKKPDVGTLRGVLVGVAASEGYTLAPDAAELIALMGDGSFRDALSTLQKVVGAVEVAGGADGAGAGAKKIDLTTTERVTGAPSLSLVLDYVEGLITGPANTAAVEKALASIRSASSQGMDILVFARRALSLARYALLLGYAAKVGGATSTISIELEKNLQDEHGVEALKRMKTIASAGVASAGGSAGANPTAGGAVTPLSKKIISLIDAVGMISRSPVPELPLEIVLVG